MDPVGIIGEIESRFGKKMNDHNLQEFISTKNVQNFTNMLSNIMNKNVTSALTVK